MSARAPRPSRSLLAAAVLALLAPAALAQDADERLPNGRRVTTGETTTLAFKNVTVERLIPFIVESTGKVVVPRQEVMSRRITILNDADIPQDEALDLVFLALQQEGIAVVETRDVITLRDIAEIDRQDVPVVGPAESVLGRTDYGTIAEKVYPLRSSNAEEVSELIEDSIPDYAKVGFDEDSNQVVVMGNVALLQRMERLIESLDRPSAAGLETRTFRLRFADAEQVAENIRELYEDDEGGRDGGGGGGNARFQMFGGRRGGGEEESSTASPSENLRVTANTQQNSVTVLAEPVIVQQVADLIDSVWDQPLDEEAVVPRIYDLRHSDPVKVQDLLEGLFGTPSASGQPGAAGASGSGGVGRLAGQFSFQAIPEAGRLVVVGKSPDNLFVIDEIIRGIDQPQTVGLPEIVELKHANAEELAEQLNTLLAREGTLAQIPRQDEGLSAGGVASSPFASEDDTAADDSATQTELITFWWQRAQPPVDNRGSSNLVGRIRIVPVWRQNAIMVLSPPEYRASVIDMVNQLDQPGRQVLISAVIAEIELEDALALGLRWSSLPITPDLADNALSIGTTTTAETTPLGSLFETSTLSLSVDLNLLLQALDQDTALNILSEPQVFTSDNQEAEFFDGQDIPFVVESQTTDVGSLIQSTDYRAVGLALRVRPRITVNRDVDLRVNLELSSLAPALTAQGQFIVDRRETTTQLIVKNGQTIVISGILRSQESDVKRKVPLLGDIPLIGLLFQSTERTTRNTELVAFITPTVVENTEELDTLNTPYRRRLGELRQELGASAPDDEIDSPAEDVDLGPAEGGGGG
jgi:general secretion pathway protein D